MTTSNAPSKPGAITYRVSGMGKGRRVTAAIGPIEATAVKHRDADDAVRLAVVRALSGSYVPAAISYAGHVAIVWREPVAGWCYRVATVADANLAEKGGHTYTQAGDSRDGAIRAARRDMVQTVCSNGDLDGPGLHGLDAYLIGTEQMLDHVRWLAFQRAYKHAQTIGGQEDNSAHRYAVGEMERAHDWLTDEERAYLA